MLATSTKTFGQTRKSAQPVHVQSSSSRTPRTGSSRRTNGDRNEPRSRQAPKREEQADSPPERPSRLPMTTTARSTPGPMKFVSPKRNAQVRRNGLSQRKRKPSASRARIGARSRARSSWNGVRIASSASVESSVRDRVDEERQRAADREERAAERRRREAHDRLAPGHDRDRRRQLALGTTERSAPAWATREDRRPAPRRTRSSGIIQKTICGRDEHHRREVPIATHARRGADHQPPAAPVVGRQPGGQREERHREQARERDESGLRGRAGQREHEQRIRDRRHLRPAARQQLRRLQQHEVAVSAQRRRGHAATLADDPARHARKAGSRIRSSRGPVSNGWDLPTPEREEPECPPERPSWPRASSRSYSPSISRAPPRGLRAEAARRRRRRTSRITATGPNSISLAWDASSGGSGNWWYCVQREGQGCFRVDPP